MRAARLRTGGPCVVLAALLLLAGCGGEEITPPHGSRDHADTRAAAATTTLRALQRGIADHDAAAVRRLAASDTASRAAVDAIAANAAALHLSDVTFRYVDRDSSRLPARLGKYGASAYAATVTTTWSVAGYDAGVIREDTRFVFVATSQGARLASVGGGGARTPLWLSEPLAVVRDPHSLVMVSKAAGESVATLAKQARQAVVDVRKVLPGWHGKLVVEEPGSERALERVLDVEAGTYQDIAGVTTTVDGQLVESAPVHVFLNPQVYDDLGAKGSQVVLSHETTHLATRAPFVEGAPTWLLEGFADYVALAHAKVPLGTAARQIIARVRKHGPPKTLPTSGDLAADAPGLGATYEEAWTVCRYLAQTYGERALVRFYDRVTAGASVDAGFRGIGTTQAAFVAGWRADLRRIAG